MYMPTGLSYDDVLLQPQYSNIRSRSEVSLRTDLGRGVVLDMPILSSPMDTITEDSMAIVMASEGGAGVVHRYNTIEKQSLLVKNAYLANKNVGGAVGVTGDYIERAGALVESGATFICVDVAHGHHILMKEALSELRKFFPHLHILSLIHI